MGILGAQLENFTIDQFAGALALTLGSIGGLLMIVWKSRCHCKFNLCWLCQCEENHHQRQMIATLKKRLKILLLLVKHLYHRDQKQDERRWLKNLKKI